MKQKDYLLLVVIAIVSGAVSLFISNTFLASDANRSMQVEVVDVIDPAFERPPADYYNETSINPTQEIRIEQDQDSNPFVEN